MECRLETIGPKKASELLKLNTFNRPISQKHVEFLAGSMSRGDWRITGDTIKVNGEVLVDGQHRLYAIIKSGVAIQCYVVRGIASNAYDAIDIIKPRTVGDHFGRAKEEHYTTLASAARWINCYENEGNFRLVFTPAIADIVVSKHKGVRAACDFVRQYRLKGMIGYGAAAGMLTIMSEKSQAEAEQFWTNICGGENLTKSMPEYVIRQRMIDNSREHRQVRPYVIYAMTIKAWNSIREKKPLKVLRWTDEEVFPVIK